MTYGAQRWGETASCPAPQGKQSCNQSTRWRCEHEPSAHVPTHIRAQGSSPLLFPADKYSEPWSPLSEKNKQFHNRVRGKQGWQMRKNISKRRELLLPSSSSSPGDPLPGTSHHCTQPFRGGLRTWSSERNHRCLQVHLETEEGSLKFRSPEFMSGTL